MTKALESVLVPAVFEDVEEYIDMVDGEDFADIPITLAQWKEFCDEQEGKR